MAESAIIPDVAEYVNAIIDHAAYNVQLAGGGKVHHAQRKTVWPICRKLARNDTTTYRKVADQATCQVCLRIMRMAVEAAERVDELTREHLLAVQKSRLRADREKEQTELAHIKDLLSRSSLGTRTKRRCR